jgi:hypothetical protein
MDGWHLIIGFRRKTPYFEIRQCIEGKQDVSRPFKVAFERILSRSIFPQFHFPQFQIFRRRGDSRINNQM